MVSDQDREARIEDTGAAAVPPSGIHGRRASALPDDQRVRIVTTLLRFGQRVADAQVMVDALLAAASQLIAERNLDARAARDDFLALLVAAHLDAADSREEARLDLLRRAENASPTGKPS